MYEDSHTRMAKVEWADAIKTVSGALKKINKKSQHAADQKMVLATHRVAPTTNPDCSRLYLRGIDSVTRSTPVTQDEIRVRAMFSAVSRAANTRMQNIATLADDMAAFKAQKDQPGGKKTFKAYIWKLEKDAYEQANG